MRISERERYTQVMGHVEDSKNQNMKALNTLSSNKRINKLYDDPVGVTNGIKIKDRLSDLGSFQKNMDFAKGFMDITESAVDTIHTRLARAQELAIGMANDTYGPESRQSTAKEVGQILSEIVQLGNTRYSSRYVFGGFRVNAPSLDLDGEFLGDDGEIFLQVEKDLYKKINIHGRELFEVNPDEFKGGHMPLVESIKLLKSGLEDNNKFEIYRSIEELGFHMSRASTFEATVGAMINSFEQIEKSNELSKENEKEALSVIDDADIYQATSDFKRTEAVFQSTLMSSNKLLQPNLFNFMN